MKNTFLSVCFVAVFGAAFWHSLTSSLDQITQRDCNAGIVKACEALK